MRAGAPPAGPHPARRPWRVLHVLPDLAIGGGQSIVWNGVRHADRDAFALHVCHLLDADDMREAFAECDVPVSSLGHGDGTGLRTVARLVRLIRSEGVDLVHVHSDLDRKHAQAAAWVTGTPVVGHLHAEWNHLAPKLPADPTRPRRLRAHVTAAARNRMERVTVRHYIAESARVRELFAPLVHAPITVLQQAVPIHRYDEARTDGSRAVVRRELALAPAQPVLVTVSRLAPGKGLEGLLRTFAEVRAGAPDVALVIVGDGELRRPLEQLAGDLGIATAVRFTGNRNDVPRLLVAADLFVFASESEGFGMVVLEAMAASLAVVAHRLPAFEEFAEHGRTADLVAVHDRGAFRDAVLALLADPARRRAMGAAGRAVVAARFDPAAVTRTFEAVYRAVLEPAAAPTPTPTMEVVRP